MADLQALGPRLRAALAEDLGPGDVTTDLLVPSDATGAARVTAKAAGVVAGVDVARRVFELAAEGGAPIEVRAALSDGSAVEPGAVVLDLAGSARALLIAERTALNFLMRLSGIATLTARYVAAVEGAGATILGTRKTTPLWRDLEKEAIRAGGGENHRFALYDAVLAKENHLAFGRDLKAALAARPPGMPAIVEAEDLDELDRAVAAGADVVLLDDFTPEQVAEARRRRGDRATPLLEVSGGVTLDTVRAYAEAGADRISVGALTHSAPALDLSLRLEPTS